jgi:uncharacterized SAM-binding protein YcdF (DUF218 family)
MNEPADVGLPAPRRWRRRLAVAACAAALLVVASPYPLVYRAPLERAEAIVVLAGSDTYVERAEYAAQLWREGRAPRVVLTADDQSAGWDERRQRNPTFTERTQDVLRAQGVPPEAVEVIPRAAENTRDEAAQVRSLAEQRGWRALLFVTSAYHTRRAWWTARRVFAGSGVTLGIDAPAPGRQTPPAWRWWSESVGWKLVAGEYLKFIYYRARY